MKFHIIMPGDNNELFRHIFPRPYYDKMRKIDIDLILGRPLLSFMTSVDGFRCQHLSQTLNIAYKMISLARYGCTGTPAPQTANIYNFNNSENLYYNAPLVNYISENYSRNKPKGHFVLEDDNFRGISYTKSNDFISLKEISDFDKEDKDIKSL